MAKKTTGEGKDYGYGQLEGSYIKPQKIDGKYWVQDQSLDRVQIPKPVGKSSDSKNSIAAKRLESQIYGRTMPKGTQPNTFRGTPISREPSGGMRSVLESVRGIMGGGLRKGAK